MDTDAEGAATIILFPSVFVSLAHATQICLPKFFTLLGTVLSFLSVDDINVSWLVVLSTIAQETDLSKPLINPSLDGQSQLRTMAYG